MHPRYTTTPITEAIIDLRTTLPEDRSLEQFAEIRTRIAERFPKSELLHRGSFLAQVGPRMSMKVDTSQEQYGYRFASADGLDIFQARMDGFAVNRLAPYESWEKFRDLAREMWEVYKAVCSPLQVNRVAVRYINHLDLPGGEINLNEYLLTVPEIGPALPQGLSHFFMQLSCPQPDIGSMLLINEALPQSAADKTSILLDFDLFREHVWPIEDEDSVWAFLEILRDRKNLAFEASITDTTRRLYI